ncbi:MAG: hypothetical protein ACOYXC_06545 [Candidatus Rifleibacteriota bacterium]
MPNHFHGIIWIVGNGDVGNGGVGNDDVGNVDVGNVDVGNDYVGNDYVGNGGVGNGRDRSLRYDGSHQITKIKPIPELIGAFKTTSSKLIHNAGKINFKWQKSYYDVIIRDNESLQRISEYIKNNPKHWNSDDYFAQ